MSLSCFGYFEIEKGEIFIFGSIFRQERMVHSCLTSSYLVPGEGESWFPNIERGCFFRVLKNGVEQRRYQRRAKEKGVETLSMSLCEEEGEREKMGDLYLMRIHRHKNKRESNTTKKSYIYSFSFFPPPLYFNDRRGMDSKISKISFVSHKLPEFESHCLKPFLNQGGSGGENKIRLMLRKGTGNVNLIEKKGKLMTRRGRFWFVG